MALVMLIDLLVVFLVVVGWLLSLGGAAERNRTPTSMPLSSVRGRARGPRAS
jgi:hypothetical protein